MSDKEKETKTTPTEAEEVTLENKKIVIEIPKDTISLDIVPTVLINGELKKVMCTMGNNEIQEGFRDCEENYFDPDATFVITEKGRQYLEEMRAKGLDVTFGADKISVTEAVDDDDEDDDDA